MRRLARAVLPWIVVLAVGATGVTASALIEALRHPIYPLGLGVRHHLARWHCLAARLVGLAPSYRGGPGYWPERAADRNGIACEPFPRR
jgi:hypothetical protein